MSRARDLADGTFSGALEAASGTFSGNVTLSGALNGVASANTFKRVVQVGQIIDGTNYSTSSTSSYAASGPVFSITSTDPGNTKLVGLITMDVRSDTNTASDGGTAMRLHWWNGSVYTPFGPTMTVLFNQNTTANVLIDDSVTIPFEATSSERRLDTGNWLLRVLFNTDYSGGVSTIYDGTMVYWEVDE